MDAALRGDRDAQWPIGTTVPIPEQEPEGTIGARSDLGARPDAGLADLDDLDDPRRVLSEGYIGIDRRRPGVAATLARATFGQRRSLLRLEFLIVMGAAAIVAALVLFPLAARPDRTNVAATTALSPPTTVHPSATHGAATHPSAAPPRAGASAPAPAKTAPSAGTGTAVPAPAATGPASLPQAAPAPAPAPAAPPTTAPAPTTTVPVQPASTPPATPSAMGAAALALVRYPWQSIPGYSIQFLPIADAPSPGFYGNTSFTWGQSGGVSTLYVYPGESIDQLAGIVAFEIGHEVDAAGVDPQGGHTQIENILGIHPASWAPECDCAEQGYLSGWYAAAFSNAWSPGVGNWASIAPEPTGAVLAAVQPWLNPSIS